MLRSITKRLSFAIPSYAPTDVSRLEEDSYPLDEVAGSAKGWLAGRESGMQWQAVKLTLPDPRQLKAFGFRRSAGSGVR